MLRGSASVLLLSLSVTLGACTATASDEGDATETSTAADSVVEAPPNFLRVRDGLYRGGHPSAGNLAYLQSLGVQTIVDLEISDFIEAYPWDISAEERNASARGFTFVRKPMSAFEPAVSTRFDDQMTSIMDILRGASAAHPVYVHCRHGQDRTGLVIGIERVELEHVAPADAYSEMLANGFHSAFLGLNHYFEARTGWDD